MIMRAVRISRENPWWGWEEDGTDGGCCVRGKVVRSKVVEFPMPNLPERPAAIRARPGVSPCSAKDEACCSWSAWVQGTATPPPSLSCFLGRLCNVILPGSRVYPLGAFKFALILKTHETFLLSLPIYISNWRTTLLAIDTNVRLNK